MNVYAERWCALIRINHIYTSVCDQAYHTRILLAALDHHMHIDRALIGGDQPQYHRVFRIRTKHWDIAPVKKQKAFSYIPELIKKICSYRYNLDQPLRTHLAGKRVASTTPITPHSTEKILQAKKSRFTSPNSNV